MNVVNLFERAPEPASDDTGVPVGGRPPPQARRAPGAALTGRSAVDDQGQPPTSPSSPSAILARAARPAGGRGARRLTPAAVIARALERPSPLETFWGVWMAHQDMLRHRSLRLSGGNRADAEDALSNAMLRAAQAYARQPVQNPRAWLLRILHNACMDQHRHNASLAAMDDAAGETAQTCAGPWEDAAPSPEEELSQAQMEQAWRQAINALPGPLSDPLRLHLEGWSDELIAVRLNVSREVVRKRRQLAKDRLRALLRL